jgi:hypothetical protein
MEIHARIGPPLEIGDVPAGRRRVVPILGGTFEGPSLRGRIVAGGADWQIIQRDGLTVLDARYTLETDRGQTIYIQNAGLRHAPPDITAKLLAGQDVDPALVYFRTVPKFETAAADLQWLTRSIFIATAERHPDNVIIRVWRVE